MPCLLQSCYHFRDELLVLSGLFNKYLNGLLYLACSFSCTKRNKLNRPQRYAKIQTYASFFREKELMNERRTNEGMNELTNERMNE